MKVIDTPLPDLKIVEPQVFGDERGFFLETYQKERFNELVYQAEFVQDNHSFSSQGILRGIHLQTKNPQGKLVRVAAGKVYDVAVDLRVESPTFGQWFGVELSGENKRQLWIPPGFGHGFYVLSENAHFEYKCTNYYDPNNELSLKWDDPTVGINWPIEASPLLSQKDIDGISLAEVKSKLTDNGK